MTPQELVHQLMCDIGGTLSVQQITASHKLDSWQVVFDADTVFDLEYDGALERVVFSSRVGRLQAEHRLQTCELLLKVNFGWRQTGGVRMALDWRSDDVVMMFEMPVATMRLSLLGTALTNLVGKHRLWRQMLLEPQASSHTSPPTVPEGPAFADEQPWSQNLP